MNHILVQLNDCLFYLYPSTIFAFAYHYGQWCFYVARAKSSRKGKGRNKLKVIIRGTGRLNAPKCPLYSFDKGTFPVRFRLCIVIAVIPLPSLVTNLKWCQLPPRYTKNFRTFKQDFYYGGITLI